MGGPRGQQGTWPVRFDMTREAVGSESQLNGPSSAGADGADPRAALPLSGAVAKEVDELLGASQDAAQGIGTRAQADAELLVRTATQEAARQAQAAVAAIATDALPQLGERVAEL